MNRDALRASVLRLVDAGRAAWEARSRRERWVVAGAIALAALALIDVAAVQPIQRESRQIKGRIDEAERALAEVNGGASQGELATLDRRIEQARRSLVEVDSALASLDGRVVSAQDMASQVREVLALARGLTILGFRNDAPVPAVAPAATTAAGQSAAGTAAPGPANRPGALYRHPLEVRVAGSYADIAAWLARIESELTGIQLGGIQLELLAPGRIEARVQCFTLSKESVWLTL